MPAATIDASTSPENRSTVTSTADFYPYELPLTFEIAPGDGHELNAIKELTITVQRDGELTAHAIVGPVNPFTAEGRCLRPMPKGLSACVVDAERSVATLLVTWHVRQAGRYTIVVSAQRDKSPRETLVVFTLDTVA